MSAPLLSKTMVISVDGTAIAKTSGFSFNVDKETVDVTTFDSTNSWKEFLVDLKEAEISFDALVARSAGADNDYEDLLTAVLANDASVVFILDDSAAPTDITGVGHITNLSLSGSLGDKQTYSGTIKPSGPITIA
jgi:predicted secreted protein